MPSYQRPRHVRLSLLPLAFLSALPATAMAQDTSGSERADGNELDPLVINATRNRSSAGETPHKVTIIDREQIKQQLAITQDPSQVLSNLIPSYSPSRQKLNNSGETFRGRSALFMVDGVPQSNPLGGGGRDSYTIDLSMVERIEVIHGASAEHGLGATGGIINYVTKRPEGAGVSQHVGVSLTSDDDFESEGFGNKVDYRLSGQDGDWDYTVAASRQKRGVFYDGDDEIVGMAYHGEIQNSESYDLMAKAGYWIDDNQNVELSLNHYDLDVDDDYVPVSGDRDAGVPTTARKGNPDNDPGYNRVTNARLSYENSDWLGNELDAQLYTQRFRAQFGATGLGSFPYQDDAGNTLFDHTRNESDKVGAKFSLSRDGLLDDRLKLTTGLDLLQDDTRQQLVKTGRNYVPESRFRNLAAFLQGDYDLTESLSLHAGVRQEHATLNVDDYSTVDRSTSVENDLVSVEGGNPDFDETLFNAGIIYQATDWAQLYANYSEGFGMPDVGRVLRGVNEPGQDVDTLIDLSPIVTDNREVGARFDWDRYGLELSYYESNSDLGQRIEPDDQGVYRVQREKTEIQGVEITGEAQVNDAHQLRLTYTHAKGKSDTDGDGSVDTKLTGRDLAPDTVKLAWSAAWNDKLSSHLQYSYYRDRSFDDPELEFDGYGLVDASLTYQLPMGRASLGIENLTDEDYFTYYSQSFPQSPALEDDLYFKGRGRTFTLSYQLDF
ncbi:TonB-dependent receptor [Aidingimonas halophila]|uniref:Iron complex outermembrane recepter protein n=1 Tax=Aidingimonas halophila TaxID=574349 RepID=A0A1H2U6G9_9GAMM|nr:TonB-dependent receptor [Aidingimonas halophila]GHC22193.1 TonB-dependent receptor [Aidingimonas halophila]SDW51114.1 iron complex outermembrane recepter protein [Aidingimonas halophila]